MPFVKPQFKTLDEYLLEVHNDICVPWLAIHDELDFLIDFNLAKPIMRRMTKMSHCKKQINKISSVPYINFLFDVEYDKWGAFSAKLNMGESTDIALSRTENNLKKEFERLKKEIIEKVKAENPETDIEYVEPVKADLTPAVSNVVIKEKKVSKDITISDESIFEIFLNLVSSLPSGETTLNIKLSSGKIISKKEIDLSSLIDILNSFKI